MTNRTASASAIAPVDSKPARRVSERALAYRSRDDGTVEVFDLDFAAYCLLTGLAIGDMVEEGFKHSGRPPNYRFVFKVDVKEIVAASVDYTNSESARFADCVRRLKKAIRSTYTREG